MHWNENDTIQNSEDPIVLFHALLELEVLVPERMSQEVEADAGCASLEEPMEYVSAKLIT